jgi:hypothetical protein
MSLGQYYTKLMLPAIAGEMSTVRWQWIFLGQQYLYLLPTAVFILIS